jgi:exosortase H (IPTLxxWG-CTERM-specific)
VADLASLATRPEVRFIALFAIILAVSFTVMALQPVNDAVVVPLTAGIARLSGTVLVALGEHVTVAGCDIRSPRFAITIYNGCNGLITSLVFVSAVLAFPASWRARALGVAAGVVAIQLLNLVRVVALYYTGALLPELFDEAHVVVWQSLIILAGVALWVVWARAATRRAGT